LGTDEDRDLATELLDRVQKKIKLDKAPPMMKAESFIEKPRPSLIDLKRIKKSHTNIALNKEELKEREI